MAATLASLNVALQRRWTQQTLEEQLYQETPFLDRLKKTDKYTVGETARVPLHVSRNGGYTPLPEGGGTLNAAGNQGLAKAEFNYANHHQAIAVQGDAIDGTKGNANAIVEAADLEIKGAVTDMNRQLIRQVFMDGSALISQCRTSSSNNVDLNTTQGTQAIERGWFFINQPIIVGTKANETSITTSTLITAIDETNVALTVAAGNITTEGTTHYVSQAKSRSGETSYEMTGMRSIFSETTTLGKLAPATEPTWKATVNSTSQPLTLSLLLQAKQKIKQKRGKAPTFMLTGLKQNRKFYEALQQQVHYSKDTGISAGSDQTVMFDNMEIWAEPDCQDEDLYLGHYDHLFMIAIDKPYWQNKVTGGEILVWVQNTDEYVSKLTYRGNLGCNRRNDGYRFSALT
jgi:hypothetical protein